MLATFTGLPNLFNIENAQHLLEPGRSCPGHQHQGYPALKPTRPRDQSKGPRLSF
jgi:hypothetical protein